MFTRRAVVFGTAQLAALGTLAGRLYYLQFIKADEYRTLSDNNRVKLQLIPPLRGHILDRHGQPLAFNEKNYQLFIEPSTMPAARLEQTLRKASDFVPLSDKRIHQLVQDIRSWPFSPPILLKDNLTWEELSRIELHSIDLPGVFVDVGQVRYYPLAEKAAHITGYVGSVSPEEAIKAEDQPLLRLPEFKIGKSGVEQMLEDRLRGTAGTRNLEVNVYGLTVRELSRKESLPGENMRLTIDARLQQFASERVGEESASVVVMDVRNGDILAMVAMPAYDPNNFSRGIATDYWNELKDNLRGPLMNKAVAGQYPPGSTFKMLVGLAGLKHGAITEASAVHCPGYFMLGDHRFNCWKPEGHGMVTIRQALQQSCDTFFYTVAERLGIEKFSDMARKFGLGTLHDVGLSGEKQAVMPDPDWKLRRFKQRWQTGDTVNAGIGQGYVLSTPLQLAVMASRIASGYAVKPRMVAPVPDLAPDVLRGAPIDVNAQHLQAVHEGMEMVVNSAGGTAYASRIQDPRFAMAGKTGTSQVRKIIQRGMNQNKLPWEYRHHALFVCYAPVDAPRYAASIFVEHGGGGASAAAPIARDVLLKIQQLDDADAQKKMIDNPLPWQ
jgi:penicillin-binding protein 2